jgi:hypothetical protein
MWAVIERVFGAGSLEREVWMGTSMRCRERGSRLPAEKANPIGAGFRNLGSCQARSAEDTRASSDSR